MLAGWASWARPVGVITREVESVDVWARFVFVARVVVGCTATGACSVQVVALGGAVQIVAWVALETVAAAVTDATGTRTVLVRWADCMVAIDALLGVCGAPTFASCSLCVFARRARRAGIVIGIQRC